MSVEFKCGMNVCFSNNINITVYYLYNFNNTWMANLSNYFSPSPNDGPEPGSVPPPPPPGPLFPNATWQWYFNEKILQSLYKSAKDAVPPAVTTTTSAPAYPTSAYPTPAYPTPAYPTPAYPVVTISSVELRRTGAYYLIYVSILIKFRLDMVHQAT